jgi:hypothetical protein
MKMARTTLSKSEKIRNLLAQGLEAKEIAKRVGVPNAYVHTVRWNAKKSAEKVAAAAISGAPAPKRGRPVNVKMKLPPKMWQKLLEDLPPMTGNPIPKVNDEVTRPSHYTVGGIETWDFIDAKNLPYHLASVIKYVSRAPYKGDELTDLRKAQQHLERRIALLTAPTTSV